MIATQVWELTDLEFYVLWHRYTGSYLPAPFTFTSRTPLLADFEREEHATWERLRAEADGALRSAFETFARPDVFVVAHGWNDQEMDNPERRIRVRAARAGVRGYLITQHPGETTWHSGGFTITECGPHDLADAVVAALPVVAAGRGNIPIVTDANREQHHYAAGLSDALDYAIESPTQQSERFLSTPAATTGVLTIHQGHSKYGPRGILEQAMLWRDLPGDGRYLMVLDEAPIAIGIGTRRLTALVDAQIEGMLDRLETHWERSR